MLCISVTWQDTINFGDKHKHSDRGGPYLLLAKVQFQNAIHGSDRAEKDPFIEQRGMDLTRWLVHESFLVENLEGLFAFIW